MPRKTKAQETQEATQRSQFEAFAFPWLKQNAVRLGGRCFLDFKKHGRGVLWLCSMGIAAAPKAWLDLTACRSLPLPPELAMELDEQIRTYEPAKQALILLTTFTGQKLFVLEPDPTPPEALKQADEFLWIDDRRSP